MLFILQFTRIRFLLLSIKYANLSLFIILYKIVFIVSFAQRSVQETDGSYFESFTALSWKRDNRRFSAIRVSETRAETLPENERDQKIEDDIERPEQLEQLYVDVLYTVANTVGAPAPGGQVI